MREFATNAALERLLNDLEECIADAQLDRDKARELIHDYMTKQLVGHA